MCEHKILEYYGVQKDNKHNEQIPLGNCIYCESTVAIDNNYKQIKGSNQYKLLGVEDLVINK